MNQEYKFKFDKKRLSHFKKISGDKNPIHFDKNIKKYSPFRKPIVYGVLILEEVLKKIIIKKTLFSINVTFKKPVFENEKIFLKIISKKKKFIYFKIHNKVEDKVLALITFGNKKSGNFYDHVVEQLRIISRKIGNFRGNINIIANLNISSNDYKFKTISKYKKISENIFCYYRENLKIRSHSNFVTFEKNFKPKIIFDRTKIKIPASAVKKKILIVGGSSGLGKILSTFFKKSKINFKSTFFKKKNSKDKKQSIKLDITKLNKTNLNQIAEYDTIYFFPSRKIFDYTGKFFSYKKLMEFNLINIYSLEKLLIFLSKYNMKQYNIFIPSTVMVENNSENLEYSLSKLMQEKLIKTYQNKFKNIKIFNPRLDALFSETTKTLLITNKDHTEFIKKTIKVL